MKLRKIGLLLGLLVLSGLLFSPSTMEAKAKKVTVSGQVKTVLGETLSSVELRFRNIHNEKVTTSVKANSKGKYSAKLVKGTYKVSVELNGGQVPVGTTTVKSSNLKQDFKGKIYRVYGGVYNKKGVLTEKGKVFGYKNVINQRLYLEIHENEKGEYFAYVVRGLYNIGIEINGKEYFKEEIFVTETNALEDIHLARDFYQVSGKVKDIDGANFTYPKVYFYRTVGGVEEESISTAPITADGYQILLSPGVYQVKVSLYGQSKYDVGTITVEEKDMIRDISTQICNRKGTIGNSLAKIEESATFVRFHNITDLLAAGDILVSVKDGTYSVAILSGTYDVTCYFSDGSTFATREIITKSDLAGNIVTNAKEAFITLVDGKGAGISNKQIYFRMKGHVGGYKKAGAISGSKAGFYGVELLQGTYDVLVKVGNQLCQVSQITMDSKEVSKKIVLDFYTVKGTVKNQFGEKSAGTVLFTQKSSGQIFTTPIQLNGSYSIKLLPGKYNVSVQFESDKYGKKTTSFASISVVNKGIAVNMREQVKGKRKFAFTGVLYDQTKIKMENYAVYVYSKKTNKVIAKGKTSEYGFSFYLPKGTYIVKTMINGTLKTVGSLQIKNKDVKKDYRAAIQVKSVFGVVINKMYRELHYFTVEIFNKKNKLVATYKYNPETESNRYRVLLVSGTYTVKVKYLVGTYKLGKIKLGMVNILKDLLVF